MAERRARRGLGPIVHRSLAAVPLVLSLAACVSVVTPSPALAPPTQASSQPAASVSAGGSPGATVPIDESLLRFLPAAVDGFDVSYSPEATLDVVTDPSLVRNAAGLAYALAVDPSTGDLVVAAAVRLRDGVFDDSFYRDWRTTYDQASCGQAGGVSGHAEATIAGRRVYIGTCNGGAHTYHVFLEAPAVLISATSVGEKRFGEQLLSNLRD